MGLPLYLPHCAEISAFRHALRRRYCVVAIRHVSEKREFVTFWWYCITNVALARIPARPRHKWLRAGKAVWHQQPGLGRACIVLQRVGLQHHSARVALHHHSARVARKLRFFQLTYSATVLPIFAAVRYMRDTPIYTAPTQIFSILWQTSVQHIFPVHRWTERGSH